MGREETSETSFEDEFDGFNNNKFNKRKMSDESYNGNLKNYFRIQRNNEMMENHVLNNNFVVEDEEIIFTENKIYIGSEANMNSMILNKVQKQSLNMLRNDNHINLSSCLKENEKLCGKNHFDPESIHNYEEVVFEKVKYDKNKKYLIESPSTSSSIGKMSSIMNFDSNSTSANFDLSNRPISEYDNVPWIFQNTGNYDNLLYHLNKSPNFKKCDHPLCGISNTSSTPPRTDENLNNSINNESAWNMLENHKNSLGKSSEQDKEKWWWFNRRGSSSTLETWIDDESYDNSFNEELEKRCSGFER